MQEVASEVLREQRRRAGVGARVLREKAAGALDSWLYAVVAVRVRILRRTNPPLGAVVHDEEGLAGPQAKREQRAMGATEVLYWEVSVVLKQADEILLAVEVPQELS